MALNVLRRWFALLHLLRNASQAQVVPGADGSEKVAKTTQQASSRVPLLLPTLARERTFQNMIGIHFCYWCIVVLWPGRRHFCVFSVFPSAFFKTVFAPGSVKKGDLRTFTKFVPSLEKSKKVDLCGQEGINPVEGCEGRLS